MQENVVNPEGEDETYLAGGGRMWINCICFLLVLHVGVREIVMEGTMMVYKVG